MKTVSSVRTPSAIRPSHPEQSYRREDFSRELAKANVSEDETQHVGSNEAKGKSPYEATDVSTGLVHAASVMEAQEDDSQPWVLTQQQLNVVVAPTGVTEDLMGSRIFGVHLLASTYLSELSTRDEDGVTSDLAPHVTASFEAYMPVTTGTDAMPARGETAVERVSAGDAGIILNLIMNEETAPMADTSQVIRTTSAATSSAINLAWPESLYRLTKDGDGRTVVWLRDYRMDGEEASRLVSALIEGARSQGARLGRIVLNGREAWASSNNC